ncbi:hypothetical protein [Celeribacter halophilus]|uniref:hypothetical protein n=1 Tax=Celeribacter halophilus TaxID=576117 RepID=UPI003A8E90A7
MRKPAKGGGRGARAVAAAARSSGFKQGGFKQGTQKHGGGRQKASSAAETFRRALQQRG